MIIVQVVAIGVISAILALTVKNHSPAIALVITLGASVLIFFTVLDELRMALGVIQDLGSDLDGRIPYVALVMQILGIAYIAEMGAQVCHDAGESAIANRIELAGKILIMVIAAPILMNVLQVVRGIMP